MAWTAIANECTQKYNENELKQQKSDVDLLENRKLALQKSYN